MGECPYCRQILVKAEAKYLLHWCNRDDADEENEAYSELKYALKKYTGISDKCRTERKRRLWGEFQNSDISYPAGDMLLSAEQVRMLKKTLEGSNVPNVRQEPSTVNVLAGNTMRRNAGLMRQDRDDSRTLTGAETPENRARQQREDINAGRLRGHQENEEAINYFFVHRNAQEPEDLQMDIAYGVRDNIIVKIRRVCPYCYSLIPDDFYHYDTLRVYLAATPGIGKTSMLYSLYCHRDKFNQENVGSAGEHGDSIYWEPVQDETIDLPFRTFVNAARSFASGQRDLDPTQVRFIPPLFFKFTVTESGTAHTILLALYDNSGESFSSRENAAGAGRDSGARLNQRIRGMDAIFCLLSLTEKTETLLDDRTSQGLSPEERARVQKEARIYSEEEQRRIEDDFSQLEPSIGELVAKMSGNEYKKGQDSREILQTLESHIGAEMTEIIKDKYLGIILSKIDKMAHSNIFRSEENGLLFGENEQYFSEGFKNLKLERDRIMEKLLSGERMPGGKRLLEYDVNRFRQKSCHFIAAYRENEKNALLPIRVEEPLVYLVLDYLVSQSRGTERSR